MNILFSCHVPQAHSLSLYPVRRLWQTRTTEGCIHSKTLHAMRRKLRFEHSSCQQGSWVAIHTRNFCQHTPIVEDVTTAAFRPAQISSISGIWGFFALLLIPLSQISCHIPYGNQQSLRARSTQRKSMLSSKDTNPIMKGNRRRQCKYWDYFWG